MASPVKDRPVRILTALSLSIICLAIGGQTADAQSTVGNLPPEFFGAQRGRVAVRPNGAFRLRYGRGLTPQGAEVISTAIGTLGPLLPQIISPMGVPMLAPYDPDAAAAYEPPEPACEPLLPDDTLDSLADPREHAGRVKRLDEMADKMVSLVRLLDREPALPKSKPATDEDGAPVTPTPGGRINPE